MNGDSLIFLLSVESMDIIHALDDANIHHIPSVTMSSLSWNASSSGIRRGQTNSNVFFLPLYYVQRSILDLSPPPEVNQTLLLVSQFLPINLTRRKDGHWKAEFDELRLLAGITWKSYYGTFNRFLLSLPSTLAKHATSAAFLSTSISRSMIDRRSKMPCAN